MFTFKRNNNSTNNENNNFRSRVESQRGLDRVWRLETNPKQVRFHFPVSSAVLRRLRLHVRVKNEMPRITGKLISDGVGDGDNDNDNDNDL